MKNQIVSYYSFKGGSGRSQMVANLAAYLCHYENKKILLIDWDLEAPGLDYFFPFDRKKVNKGLIEVFEEYVRLVRSGEELSLEQLPFFDETYTIVEGKEGGKIDLIPAANYNSEDFTKRINAFDWFDFYDRLDGRYYVEFLKGKLKENDYDFIFIDSRTGNSDYLGICNIQLPDINIIVVAPSKQNLEGAYKIATKILEHPYTKENRPNPIVLPVFSRVDEQYGDKYNEWQKLFLGSFRDIINNTIKYTRNIINEADNFIRNATINYEVNLAYGETVKFAENKIDIVPGSIEEKFITIWSYVIKEEVSGLHIGDSNYVYFPDFQQIKIPHLLTNNIPTNADHILGRNVELSTIKSHLDNNRVTVLVNGIGGIGKTAVASKYMANYGSEYKHLAWITVQSTLEEAFANNMPLLASLNITQHVQDHIAAKQLDMAFEYIFHHLNLLERTLIVIDNANDLNDLEQYKNWFDNANCHFLITSRSQPTEWTTVEVDNLPEDEAVALFRKQYPLVPADDEAIKKLLSKLFYHTLLIELVAKAGSTTGISFADLQTMIETKFIHDEQLNEDIVSTGKHGDSVSNNTKRAKIEEYIWLIFSNVRDLGDVAKQVLRCMALLPVATPFNRDFLKKHLALFEVKDIVPNLSLLVEKGWLDKDDNKWFKIHPLIADVVVKHLEVDVEFSEEYIKRIAALIFYDSTNPKHNLFVINENKRFAERLVELFFDKKTEGMSELLDNLGFLEENFGFYQKAVMYKERALAIAETIFDKGDKTIALRQSNLANVYSELGKYESAAALLETALASDLTNFGKDHPSVARSESNLANVYRELSRYDKAAVLLETALASDLKNFGQEHPTIAVRQSNLANVYRELGCYDQAVELLEAALTSDLKNFGKDHPLISRSQSNLANVYSELGRYDQAVELLEAALTSDLRNFGKDHPSVSRSQSNLANVYSELGRYDQAIKLLEAALTSDLKNFGEDHPLVSRSQSNLANVYRKLGIEGDAANLLGMALESDLKNFSKDHPSVSRTQSDLANVYSDLGMYDIAIELLETALASDLKNFGKDHPQVAIKQNNLALAYFETGRKVEAKALWQSAYQNFLKNMGKSHPITVQLKENLEK